MSQMLQEVVNESTVEADMTIRRKFECTSDSNLAEWWERLLKRNDFDRKSLEVKRESRKPKSKSE
jgi:hypothetical protein